MSARESAHRFADLREQSRAVPTHPEPSRSHRPETPEETDRRVRTSLIGGIVALLLTVAGAAILLELSQTQKAQVCIEQNRRNCMAITGDLPSGRAR